MRKLARLNKAAVARAISDLLANSGVDALPIKLYSNDSDIDLLIVSPPLYRGAQKVLVINGWKRQNNLSKLRERDKDFYISPNGRFHLHLHRAISWNTVRYLDSEVVWKRRRVKNRVAMPSTEDELLIISAHSIFENKRIVPEEMHYAKNLVRHRLNWRYMNGHAKRFGWEKGLKLIKEKLAGNNPVLEPTELISVSAVKITRDLLQGRLRDVVREAINYLFVDWIWCWRKMRKRFPGPMYITISGVDGSGKSTLAHMLRNKLESARINAIVVHIGGGIPSMEGKSTSIAIRAPSILVLLKDLSQVIWNSMRFRFVDAIIFDRYYYDTLVKIAYRQKNTYIPKWQKRVLSFFRRPSLAVLLIAPAKVTFGRDKDFSIQYHQEKLKLYGGLGADIEFVRVDATKQKRYVLNRVVSRAMQLFEDRVV